MSEFSSQHSTEGMRAPPGNQTGGCAPPIKDLAAPPCGQERCWIRAAGRPPCNRLAQRRGCEIRWRRCGMKTQRE
jgi:hypothetical protein